jgi:MFS superfamily sulfate permease-like transporter
MSASRLDVFLRIKPRPQIKFIVGGSRYTAQPCLFSHINLCSEYVLHQPGSPESVDLLLALAFSAVLISGSVQILLGAFRVGGLVKFMPYPVVAGIRNTTALLLI